MQRNHLGRSIAATLVFILAGCASSGDEQVAEIPATPVVTEDNGTSVTNNAVVETDTDDGWTAEESLRNPKGGLPLMLRLTGTGQNTLITITRPPTSIST